MRTLYIFIYIYLEEVCKFCDSDLDLNEYTYATPDGSESNLNKTWLLTDVEPTLVSASYFLRSEQSFWKFKAKHK